MWRFVVVLLALATLFAGTTGIADDHGHVPDTMPHASDAGDRGGPDLDPSAAARDDCSGPACCTALHCPSCAAAPDPDLSSRWSGEPARLAFHNPALSWVGRVIAPPTAPPKSA